MDPKETSKPIPSSPAMDSIDKQAAAAGASAPQVSAASRSSHVIDLRGGPKAAPSASDIKPVKKAAVKPGVIEKSKPAPKPVFEQDPQEAEVASIQPAPSASVPKRAFWPAFIRFIVLLIVFAGLIAGAAYIYLTYYHQ
jgi:hypothetical protein